MITELIGLSLQIRSSYHKDKPMGRGLGVQTPPHGKSLSFLRNTGQTPLEITKLPSQHSILGHHQPASETPFKSGFHWQADDGPLSVVYWVF